MSLAPRRRRRGRRLPGGRGGAAPATTLLATAVHWATLRPRARPANAGVIGGSGDAQVGWAAGKCGRGWGRPGTGLWMGTGTRTSGGDDEVAHNLLGRGLGLGLGMGTGTTAVDGLAVDVRRGCVYWCVMAGWKNQNSKQKSCCLFFCHTPQLLICLLLKLLQQLPRTSFTTSRTPLTTSMTSCRTSCYATSCTIACTNSSTTSCTSSPRTSSTISLVAMSRRPGCWQTRRRSKSPGRRQKSRRPVFPWRTRRPDATRRHGHRRR